MIQPTPSRYARQEILLGIAGQQALTQAHIAIIGCGALGSVAADLCARAGIGTIDLFDHDIVDLTNLQRQALYTQADIGLSKAEALMQHLRTINRDITITAHAIHIDSETIRKLDATLIIDGTDNLDTRHIIDAYAYEKKIPWILGAAIKDRGYASAILPQGPRLSDVFPSTIGRESCEEYGVLASTTHIIAALQVSFAIDILCGKKVTPTLHSLDLSTGTIEKIAIPQGFSRKKHTHTSPTGLFLRPCTSRKGTICSIGRRVDIDLAHIAKELGWEHTNSLVIHDSDIYIYRHGDIIFRKTMSDEEMKTFARNIYKLCNISL